jgi:hypothetical protein
LSFSPAYEIQSAYQSYRVGQGLHRKLLGVFSVGSKVVFRIEDLPRFISHQIFGCDELEGIKKLKLFKVKGRISGKTEMAFISLNYEYYDPKYEIKDKPTKSNSTDFK